ncbi:hypothetical protein ACFQDZ_26730 [Sulfitobacter pacificus]|uniref:hypothetical protein n=1 Tax=Sulfitobacter pacificus TaxID=1499314 RepID=UPI00361E36F5
MDPSSSLPVGDSLSIVPYEGRTEIFFFVEFNVSYHLAESGMETVTITLCRWVRRIGTSEFRKKEATPIARLRDANDRTTGWVYHWNTSELAILWIYKDRMAKRIDPPLSPETLAKAKAVTADSAIDLLEALSAGGQKSWSDAKNRNTTALSILYYE